MIDYNEFCQNDITLRDYQQLAKEDIFDKWNLLTISYTKCPRVRVRLDYSHQSFEI